MVDIGPALPSDRQLIQGYGGGIFRIAGAVHHGSVIVFPTRTEAWPVASIDEVTPASLDPVVREEVPPEVLVLGGGPTFPRPMARLAAGLREHGIVVEFMDTGAACRTFNLLLGDGRRVAAALIAID